MGPQAALLPDGQRLHLHHGPIDLIIGADGARERAFAAAQDRFATVLSELVSELPDLRAPLTAQSAVPMGAVACRMDQATRPFCEAAFITRMAAVAGSVADEILMAMVGAAELHRAYVNNGGDIALHLTGKAQFALAMADHGAGDLGRIVVTADDPVRGIATSGRHGRSLSLGLADSVTVLAHTAAEADAAATLIANAVDLPGHARVHRRPASDLDDDSDLGRRSVVWHCDPLAASDIDTALAKGLAVAEDMVHAGRITAAAMFLQGRVRSTHSARFMRDQRRLEHA